MLIPNVVSPIYSIILPSLADLLFVPWSHLPLKLRICLYYQLETSPIWHGDTKHCVEDFQFGPRRLDK